VNRANDSPFAQTHKHKIAKEDVKNVIPNTVPWRSTPSQQNILPIDLK